MFNTYSVLIDELDFNLNLINIKIIKNEKTSIN